MTKGGVESAVPDVAREEKRRQLTTLALGIGLFVSTIPVNNQRALFSPLGDIPILGELTPTAYAVTLGGVPSGGAPGVGRPGGAGPPVAYAARVPGLPSGGVPRGGQPFSGTPFAGPPGGATNIPPTSSIGNENPGPNGGFVPSVPAGIPGGGGGGGPGPSAPGTGNGGGGLPSPGVVGAVPEPATWLTMIIGFGVIGGIMRRSRRRDLVRGRRVTDMEGLLSEG